MKWSLFWYSRRESNPKFALRRGMLDPFNYGSIFSFLDTSQSRKNEKYPFGCKKDVNSFAVSRFVSELTPKIRLFAPFCLQFLGYSTPLGGVYYIHLTTEAFYKLQKRFYRFATCLSRNRRAKKPLRFLISDKWTRWLRQSRRPPPPLRVGGYVWYGSRPRRTIRRFWSCRLRPQRYIRFCRCRRSL